MKTLQSGINDSTFLLRHSDIGLLAERLGFDAFMDQLVERLEQVFIEFSEETWAIPARDGFSYTNPDPGLVEWMPAMRRGNLVLMKVVGYHPNNPERHSISTIQSTLALFDISNGALKAIVDGEFLTALRTGAASAIATRKFSRPESSVLGLIGAGAQAVTQAHAISRVRPIRQILVHDIDPQSEMSLCERFSCLNSGGIEILRSEKAEMLRQSDILCTATSVEPGAGPVFSSQLYLKPGMHINAIGSDFVGKIEIPKDVLEGAYVCPDFLSQAMKEGESQQLKLHQIGDELSTICRLNRCEEWSERLTVFDSTGYALEDFVAAELAIELAVKQGVGNQMGLRRTGGDPKNPYSFLAADVTSSSKFMDCVFRRLSDT